MGVRTRLSSQMERRLPTVLVVVGALLVVANVGLYFVFDGVSLRTVTSVEFVAALVLNVPFGLGILYGGYWLERNRVSRSRYPRIGAWCFTVLAAFLGLNLAIMFVWPTDTLRSNLGWAISVTGIGGAFGLAIGVIEARAIERAREAERERTRAEMAQEQIEWLDYVNRLLRHEVLNTATVIEGNATVLLEDPSLEPGTAERLETVQSQSREMASVIEDVRTLLEAQHVTPKLEEVDLTTVLEEEAEDVRSTYAGSEVVTDLPDQVTVMADDIMSRVFSNLLANAVEHNDSETPRVEVTGVANPGSVVVEVADDGPGIPQQERATLFERSDTASDHGLGLYLARTLVERYGGSLELAETGPDGTTFRVELPRVSDGSSDPDSVDQPRRVSETCSP